MILQLLNDIENAVIFARLKTLHNSIIKIEELESILETIVKYYSVDQLIFPNASNNTHRYYDLLEVEAYYSGSKIVFVIHFPIVYPETFHYYHLFSIPTENLTTIIPRNTYLVMNKNFYQYVSLPCIELHPDYYCPIDNLLYGSKNQDCVFELLQLDSTYENCEQVPITISETIIQQIDGSNFISVFPNQTKIKLTCDRTDFTSLKGNYLIKVPLGCRFQTNDNNFINEKVVSSAKPLLLPEISIPQKSSKIKLPKISIQNVNLDKIHELQNEQNKIALIEPKYQELPIFNQTHFWTIPIYSILLIAGLYTIYKYFQRRRRRVPETSDEPQEDGISTSTFPFPKKMPRSSGGGVM